jgi:hypothetical protein
MGFTDITIERKNLYNIVQSEAWRDTSLERTTFGYDFSGNVISLWAEIKGKL